MAAYEYDYGAIKSAINTAKSMSGNWGVYGTYGSDLNLMLNSSLAEWQLSGSEPCGNTYVVDAQGIIANKKSDLETIMGSWKTLSDNLTAFKGYIEDQDKAVETIFFSTSAQYTNYTGVSGFFTAFLDYNFSFIVDVFNSNAFTRGIADWTKSMCDDLGSAMRDARDYFAHGDGKYILNIVKSVAITAGAVVGTVIAIITLPFDGGASLPLVVGCIGAVASGVAAIISAFNTYHTIRENASAISIEDDPARARLHGDVESYSDHVSVTVYDSPEEYQHYATVGNVLDTTKNVCEVVSMASGLANTLGMVRSTEVVDGVTRVHYSYDFSAAHVKESVLKMFGLSSRQTTETTVNVEVSDIDFAWPGGNPDTVSVSVYDYLDEVPMQGGLTLSLDDGERAFNVANTVTTTEYHMVSTTEGGIWNLYTEASRTTQTTTTSLDFANALRSGTNVSYLSDVSRYGEGTANALRTLRNTEDLFSIVEKSTGFFDGVEGTDVANMAKIILNENKFFGAIDKYVYKFPIGSDNTWDDYLRAIGGSNADKVWKCFGY